MTLVAASEADKGAEANWKYLVESYERMKRTSKDHVCDSAPNKNLCLPKSYSKFELPHTEQVNVVEIGIDIIDVLRINDKVSKCNSTLSAYKSTCLWWQWASQIII